jgi:hypothetical protein
MLILVLYSPELLSTDIPVLSDINFEQKTTLTLTFTIAVFAAIEGYSMFVRASLETKRFKLEDAKNELEKAYGPLYALLNKSSASNASENAFWLDFDERKKLDEIMATYPFMFPPQINDMWRDKIRTLGSTLETDNLKPTGYGINLGVYVEFRNLINEEYARKVKNYHDILEKGTPSV